MGDAFPESPVSSWIFTGEGGEIFERMEEAEENATTKIPITNICMAIPMYPQTSPAIAIPLPWMGV